MYLILCAKFILSFAVLHCLTCLRKLTFLTIACNKFYIQPCRTNVRKLFISNYGAVVWNNLNDAMFTFTLKSFKLLSKSNTLSSYS